MQQRVRNQQPTYPLDPEDVSSDGTSVNYYPINSAISMKDYDSGRVFTVINDHTQGGTSPSAGLFEIMLNRRINRDDGRGMGESLNEIDPVT